MADPGARRLGGRYELGPLLGYGGMAEVHKGRDVRLGRDVAVKTLRADLARDPAFQSRFRREAQSAASLNHPSVVAVYDTGEDPAGDGGSAPYIVMEFVDGRTLRDVLETEGRLLPERALEITADILAALDYSHRAGIIHRDIKPGNVMLTRTGDVKVMDFGIARALTGATSTMTQTAAVVGTAQYLSPEQARGEHVDQRSDIYSTGCLLYELLTGRPPFVGDTPVSVAYQHVREDAVPPSRLNPDVSPALDSIVLKAMAKNPANRYQSAADMRGDMQRALAGRPVEATPVLADAPTAYGPTAATTVLRRPAPDRQRRRTIAYVLLGLAVLGIFIGAALVAKALFSGSGSSGVPTPDVLGKPLAQAEQEITAAGLVVGTVTPAYQGASGCDQPKGRVCNQSPLGKIASNKGASVNLTVSLGRQQVQVPNVVDLSRNDATKALKDAKLAVGSITEQDSTQKSGTVLSQTPAAGATVDAGGKVDLVIASGKTALPDVVGLDVNAATDQLHQAGFSVSTKSQPTNDPTQIGKVLTQSPAGGNGATASSGTTVTLTVGSAPASPTPSATPPPTTSPSP
ncbi:MAG: Stk1 family PASTA domain-containing Ser/Thr kinase [Actinomycetes bacterium]